MYRGDLVRGGCNPGVSYRIVSYREVEDEEKKRGERGGVTVYHRRFSGGWPQGERASERTAGPAGVYWRRRRAEGLSRLVLNKWGYRRLSVLTPANI
jgi:hypothetical protein